MDIKRENFRRISESRMTKILTILDQFKNLSNTSFYSYSDEEIKNIFNNIISKAKETEEFLLAKNKFKRKEL